MQPPSQSSTVEVQTKYKALTIQLTATQEADLKIRIVGCADEVLVRDAVQVDGSFQQLLKFRQVLVVVRGRQLVSIPATTTHTFLKAELAAASMQTPFMHSECPPTCDERKAISREHAACGIQPRIASFQKMALKTAT
jgi:hypothetical protein